MGNTRRCVSIKNRAQARRFRLYLLHRRRRRPKIIVDRGQLQPTLKSLREDYLNGDAPPTKEERQLAYDVFENKETYRWPGDTIDSCYNGWYQYILDLWEPYLTDLLIGNKRWEDITPELRPKSEVLLATGEVPTA